MPHAVFLGKYHPFFLCRMSILNFSKTNILVTVDRKDVQTEITLETFSNDQIQANGELCP